MRENLPPSSSATARGPVGQRTAAAKSSASASKWAPNMDNVYDVCNQPFVCLHSFYGPPHDDCSPLLLRPDLSKAHVAMLLTSFRTVFLRSPRRRREGVRVTRKRRKIRERKTKQARKTRRRGKSQRNRKKQKMNMMMTMRMHQILAEQS